ncbi:MAG TPA: ABC transporter ATP-binding protein [Acidimicrobiia bacterium]|nr:ABC transporter ATP-binding protein [Acidimicrobiia bacterium]
MTGSRALLEVESVTTRYTVRRQGGDGVAVLTAVDSASLTIAEGETVGLVGESGCGKSTLGRTIMRLVDPAAGRIFFRGRDITELDHGDMRPVRRDFQIVFQDPYASLNPRFRVRAILAEPFRIHGLGRAEAARRAPELLDLVQLPLAALDRYPHEFSGGQRQRIAIARALALQPALIVLDEPVSALDVSIQAQILNLLADLKDQLGLAYLFIAHDLSVVGQVSDRVAVMYLGKIVEIGTRDDVFTAPQHPYTNALLSAVPSHRLDGGKRTRIVLEGDLPNPLQPPSGCRFRTRCWRAVDLCADEDPVLVQGQGMTQRVACHFPGPEAARGTRRGPLPPNAGSGS